VAGTRICKGFALRSRIGRGNCDCCWPRSRKAAEAKPRRPEGTSHAGLSP
jgi:hypothetical protein